MAMIRVAIPYHLRNLAQVDGELAIDVDDSKSVTIAAVLDALETRFPMLRGTIRDHDTHQRRPFLRYYACQQDYSLAEPDAPLPDAVARGEQPLLIVGAIAGG